MTCMHTLEKNTNVGIPNTCTLCAVTTVLSNVLSNNYSYIVYQYHIIFAFSLGERYYVTFALCHCKSADISPVCYVDAPYAMG